MGLPHTRAVEARAGVGDLDHQAPVGPRADLDRGAAVLLGVRDHLVQGQHQVARALGEAAAHGEVAHRRADLGDLGGIVTEGHAVAPRSPPPLLDAWRSADAPSVAPDTRETVAIGSDPARAPGSAASAATTKGRCRLADAVAFG